MLHKSPAQVQLEQAWAAWEDEIQDGGEQTRIAFLLGEWLCQQTGCYLAVVWLT